MTENQYLEERIELKMCKFSNIETIEKKNQKLKNKVVTF